MSSSDLDFYKLLEVEFGASIEQIQRAYRKRSLLCHPDKVGDDPQAAILFHQLNLARDTLADDVKRTLYDDLYRLKIQREIRFKEMDLKRQRERTLLEERESHAKKAKGFTQLELQKLEMERLRDETRVRMDAMAKQKSASIHVASMVSEQVKLAHETIRNASVLDCTLKLKWKSLAFDIKSLKELFPNARVLYKEGKKSASIVFENVQDAYNQDKTIAGCQFSWAGGKEPEACSAIRLLEQMAQTETLISKSTFIPLQEPSSEVNKPSSFDAYQDLTLKRMREREQMRQEILQQESQEL